MIHIPLLRCFAQPALLLAVATMFAIDPTRAAETIERTPTITYRIKDTAPPPAPTNEVDGKWPTDPALAWRAVDYALKRLEKDIAYAEEELREEIVKAKAKPGWNDAAAKTPKRPDKAVIAAKTDAELARLKEHCDLLERYQEIIRRQTRVIDGGHFAKPAARTFRTATEVIKAMTYMEGKQTRTDEDRVKQEIVEVTLIAERLTLGHSGFTRFDVQFTNLREVGTKGRGKGVWMDGLKVHCYDDEAAEAKRRLEGKVVTMKITGVIHRATAGKEEVSLVLEDARIEVLALEDDKNFIPTVAPDLTKAGPERKPFDGKSIDKLPPAEQMTELMREGGKLRTESRILRQALEGNIREAAKMKGIDAALLKPPKEPGSGPQGAIGEKDLPAMKKSVTEWIAYRDGLHTQVRDLKAAMAKVWEGKK